MSDVQALEYILFFVFPRGDVNPLAHRLLKRFNSGSNCLEASVEDLMEVKGMDLPSVQKLQSLLEVFYYYSLEKTCNIDCLKTICDFYEYIEQLLRFRQVEKTCFFGVGNSGEVIKGRRFGSGSIDKVVLDMREIALYISTHKVKADIFLHNHPDGTSKESLQDKEAYGKLMNVFSFSDANFLILLLSAKKGLSA